MRNSGWLSDMNRLWRAGGGVRAVFIAYAAFTLLLFMVLGAWGVWLTKDGARSSSSMQRFAASVIKPFFLDMLSLEVPHLSQERQGSSTFAGKRVVGYLTGLWLQVNPAEPRSLLAGELRGLVRGSESVIDSGSTRNGAQPSTVQAGGSSVAHVTPTPTPTVRPQAQEKQPAQVDNHAAASPIPSPTPPQESTVVNGPVKLSTEGKKAVLIYHSHPRESWVPELQAKSVGDAENPENNITLVGKRLAEQLEQAGIGTIHSGTDYKTTVPQYNWNFSYKYSQQTVQEAFAVNDSLKFLFDIHRDSATRDVTTATINGKDYAKVYFIVGKKNEKWEQNEAFAKKIHERLQADYPGLSRGILDKGTSSGHGEYNQSLSPNSMLMEVGGAYNTLEESNRTADVLAKVIADLFWNAEKVNGTVSAGTNKTPDSSS